MPGYFHFAPLPQNLAVGPNQESRALDAFDAQRALTVEISDLRRRLDERQTVVRAVTLLAARGARDDAAAYAQLRQMAMAWRVSFEDAAARVVAMLTAAPEEARDDRG